MARARRNPIGLPLADVQLVRVGSGVHTHIYDPVKRVHLCQSGRNAGRKGGSGAEPPLFPSDAGTVTCYRCVKLATMNIENGRAPWQSR